MHVGTFWPQVYLAHESTHQVMPNGGRICLAANASQKYTIAMAIPTVLGSIRFPVYYPSQSTQDHMNHGTARHRDAWIKIANGSTARLGSSTSCSTSSSTSCSSAVQHAAWVTTVLAE